MFLCHSIKLICIWKNGYRFNKCAGCGLVFLENIPKNLVDYYGQGYFSGDVKLDGYMDYDNEKQISLKLLKIFKQNRRAGRPGRLLWRQLRHRVFFRLAKARNWEAFGIDVSAYAGGSQKRIDEACAVLNDLAPESTIKFTMWWRCLMPWST